MRRALPLALSAVLLLGAAAVWAGWPAVQIPLQPRVQTLAPKAPTVLTAAAAGEVHVTLSGKAVCVRLVCTVDANFITSPSAAPVTATANSNLLPARAVDSALCLASTDDYLSIYLSAAGTCYPAERASP